MLKSSLGWGWALALAGLLAVGCNDSTGGKDGGDGCDADGDCSGGQVCAAGRCVDCRVDSDCASGQVCLGNECLTSCPEQERCERGGDCCPGDWECIGTTCRAPCAGQRCGHLEELCCQAGWTCEQERCVVDCGGAERCGEQLDTCCSADQICYGFTCTKPTGACVLQSDCPQGYVCERDLGICVEEAAIGDCLYHPPVGQFNPGIECRWTPGDGVTPARNDVVMAPVVAILADTNGDGQTNTFDTPSVAFVSYDYEGDGCCNRDGTLRIVSGRCNPDGSMQTLFSSADPGLDNSGGLAVGDLDGDGIAEIVGVLNNSRNPQGTVAFERLSDDGTSWGVRWTNPDFPTWDVHTRGATQPSLADLDGDGHPEVVVGNAVLAWDDGHLIWDGVVTSNGSGGIGNNAFLGPVSTVADVDLDGHPEVLAGNTAYGFDGTPKWTYTYTTNNSPCGGDLPCDGFTASGNFDDDPYGEVVIVRRGEVFVLEHDGDLLARIPIPTDDCDNNESGPPTVADFDGDGEPEIGTAAADFYVVVDLGCDVDPLPAECLQRGVLWAVPNQDCSSRVTASSVFDFDGDGRAEVVYADESNFRIFDGQTGTILYDDPTHGSHTRLEMAVIADVDNDGNAEVVIAENGYNNGNPGVEIWGDADDNWVFTRRIWNQHAYHVTNVSETGKIPADEDPNWSQAHLNNFRQNVQGEGLFWAPDLVIRNLNVVCELDQSIYLSFDLVNLGSRMVGAGVAATVYVDAAAIATVETSQPLLPGQLEHFGLSWDLPADLRDRAFPVSVAADDRGDGTGAHNECEDGGEDNNVAQRSSVQCGGVD